MQATLASIALPPPPSAVQKPALPAGLPPATVVNSAPVASAKAQASSRLSDLFTFVKLQFDL